MDITELLPNIGKPIYYPLALARALGSNEAAILLCYLFDLQTEEADPELGVYKTKAELTKETSLSAYEQDIVTAKLRQLGLLTMSYNRPEHRTRYLLDIEAIKAFLERARASFPD